MGVIAVPKSALLERGMEVLEPLSRMNVKACAELSELCALDDELCWRVQTLWQVVTCERNAERGSPVKNEKTEATRDCRENQRGAMDADEQTSEHVQPASTTQAAEQPSPLVPLPSSHCSLADLLPLPHSSIQKLEEDWEEEDEEYTST
jgi:hypothetical protein